MSQCLGESGYLFLIDGVILLVLFHIVRFMFAKLRTMYQTSKHQPRLFTKINEKSAISTGIKEQDILDFAVKPSLFGNKKA
jgi:hypothetical protein